MDDDARYAGICGIARRTSTDASGALLVRGAPGALFGEAAAGAHYAQNQAVTINAARCGQARRLE